MSLAECLLPGDILVAIGRVLAAEFAMPAAEVVGTRRAATPAGWYRHFRGVSKELTALLEYYIPECRPVNRPPWLSKYHLTTFYLAMAAHNVIVHYAPIYLSPFQRAALAKIRDDRGTWDATHMLFITHYRRDGWTVLMSMLLRALAELGLGDMVTVCVLTRRGGSVYDEFQQWTPNMGKYGYKFAGLTQYHRGRTDTMPIIICDGALYYQDRDAIYDFFKTRGCLILTEWGTNTRNGLLLNRHEGDPLIAFSNTTPSMDKD